MQPQPKKKSFFNIFFNNLFKERVSMKKYFVFNTIYIATLSMLLNVILCISLVYVSLTKKIYMQPPFLVNELTELDYKNGVLYEETLRNFAEFFISFSENLTSENAEKRVAKAKAVLGEEFYKEFAPVLDKRVTEIKENNLVRTFHFSQEEIDISEYGKIKLKGIRVKSVGQNVLQSLKIEMTIYYTFKNGISINKIEEK